MKHLGFTPQPGYRVVNRAEMIERLLCCGWIHELQWEKRERAVDGAAKALDELIALGLPFRTGRNGEQFDPVEVDHMIRRLGAHDQYGLWKRFVACGRELVREFHPAGAEGIPPPATLPPQRFAVTFRREFNLDHLEPGTKVRLRSPLPIEDEALHELRLEDVVSAGLASDPVITPGRLEARFLVPAERTVALTWTASFTAYPTSPRGAPHPLPPSELELYTRPKENLIRTGPKVRALADALAGSQREPWDTVRAFWDFLFERLTFGAIHYDQIDQANPIDQILESGWYNCHLGSCLLVALCRVRGIPARLVSGYLIYPKCPDLHYWAEFWDEARGWVPIDSFSTELSFSGRDRLWRDYFFGQLDYRMKTECLPQLFTGIPTVRFPPVWHRLIRPLGTGVEMGIFDTNSGAPVYRDQLAVERVKVGPS